MLYKTGFVLISPTVAEWQATQNCVTDRHKIFPLTAIAPILNGGWGQKAVHAVCHFVGHFLCCFGLQVPGCTGAR